MNWTQTRERLIALGIPVAGLPEEWQPRIDLRGANLSWADLSGADLRWADLSEAYLSWADLSEAYLRRADLRRADLRRAELRRAVVNWNSHDLLAEILRRAAGDNVPRRMLAGLILVSRDWCWKTFLAAEIDPALRQWALDEFRLWVKEGDNAPEILLSTPACHNAGPPCPRKLNSL